MHSHSKVQVLFLQWHKHNGICSIEQIRNACSNLMRSFDIDTKNVLYKIFFPLIRKGFIEFCGNGKYQVSQPTILFYKKEQIAVGINLLTEQKQALEEPEPISEDDFGVVRLKMEKKFIHDFCTKINCNLSEPNVSEMLSNFPKIEDIVRTFKSALISSSGEYFDVMMHRWRHNKNSSYGLFRLSKDSYKYYLRTEKGDYQIPDFKTNPEGRNLAECFQAKEERKKFLFYDNANKVLTIKQINIPILIERILRMASLHSQNGVKEEKKTVIYQNISLSTVYQLNRIFGTKANI